MIEKTSAFREMLPGLGIALTIAIISFMASSLHEAFDALVISIIFGMLVANMFDERGMLKRGIDAALKFFLPVGIGLYGIQLRFVGMEVRYWLATMGVFLLMFITSYFIARGFGISKRLALLLSTGMSVCGATAIVIVAPALRAEKEDTSISILSVMTVGLTGMLFYRFLPELMGLSLGRFAFLSGMTLPMIGQVKVASVSLGPESLQLASNFKLMRISALVVVAALAIIFPTEGKEKGYYLPWFMGLFFALALASTLSQSVAQMREFVEPVSKFSLSVALAAIGLSLHFDSVTERGASPLFTCFLSWGIVVLTIYLFFSIVT
jgi:uncharacterized integral membrane protein (TIGR00698 family)